ncbi:MAG: hypothetical protein AAF668_15545 [Pseudomonadota bacterium]
MPRNLSDPFNHQLDDGTRDGFSIQIEVSSASSIERKGIGFSGWVRAAMQDSRPVPRNTWMHV